VPPGTLVPKGRGAAGGRAVIAGGLASPAVARGVSSIVPSASAPGIGPPAPLVGAINGGYPLPREGVAEWVDPPKHTAPLVDQCSQAARKRQ